MANSKFKIAGVPEHFNFPWHFAEEQGYFANNDLEISWQDVKSGTGTLTKMLNSGEVDLAVLLTEGIIADIAKGGQSKIIQVFVKSPLNWGIHVAAGSPIQHKFGIKGKRFAISRLGSGSHIMAYVLAEQLGYIPAEKDFVIVNDMEGAKKSTNQWRGRCFFMGKIHDNAHD
jgi:sulfonate transport system substrate-binding protein